MTNKTFSVFVLPCLLLSGCGSDSNPVVTPTASIQSLPSITVDASLNKTKAFVGEPVVLSWQSTNSSTCSILGTTTSNTDRSGSITLIPTAGGKFTYTVQCTGSGYSAKKDVTLTVPMPVYPTSYENKNSISFNKTQVPRLDVLGIPKVFPDEYGMHERPVAFGDFLQSGEYTAFVSSSRAANLYGVPGLADTPGVGYFLHQNPNGIWTDVSADLFETLEDRTTCVWPSYSIVADFNNDKKPDIYIACTGVDYDLQLSPSDPKKYDIYLSNQVLMLSQPNGKYKRIDVPFHIYGHQAAAADLNHDGNIDILTTNMSGTTMENDTPFVLLGNGDGTFTKTKSLVPSTLLKFYGQSTTAIFNVELIPLDGRIDVVFGGTSTIYAKGLNGSGFDFANAVTFKMETSDKTGDPYDFPLNVYYENNRFYFLQTAHMYDTSGAFIGERWHLNAYDQSGQYNKTMYEFINLTQQFQSYGAQFKPDQSGNFVLYTAGCGPGYGGGQGMCTMNVTYR